MRKFESIIAKIKFDILREVAQYAYEGTLEDKKDDIPYHIVPGTKSSFRCCVYRERAIIFQRVRLAMGKAPNDSEASRKNGKYENVVHVINSACEQCSINRFTVTENCQGCLAKRCVEVCPFKAVSIVNRKAYIDQDMCKECGKCKAACPYSAIADQMRPCKRSCPVDAIQIDEERKAVIDYDKCISCGRCSVDCPFGAISDKQYIVPVIDSIKSGKKVYAAVAPSIEGQFGDKATLGMIKSSLKELGFTDVYEVALGADMVAVHEAEEFDSSIDEKGVMTSSCCPSFVNLVKKHYPELLNKVSKTVSPMQAITRYIKSSYEDSTVVFIGPCYAKKAEASEYEDGPDYVLTFEEIEAMLAAKGIEVEDCEADNKEHATSSGKLFARSGGVSDAVARAIDEGDYKNSISPVKCSGIDECKKALMMAKTGKLEGNFIEGMACINGCVGGPSIIANSAKTKRAIEKSGAVSLNTNIHANVHKADINSISLDRSDS